MVLLVVAGMSVLGVGGCLLVGLFAFASGQEDRKVAPESPGSGTSTPGTALPAPGTPKAASNAGDPTNTDDDHDDPHAGSDPPGTEPNGAHAGTTPPSSTAKPTSTGKTRWFCNATGWVRKCGFGGSCASQMVSGIGSGDNLVMAQQMAKNACENQARIYGGGVCSVACTPKTK